MAVDEAQLIDDAHTLEALRLLLNFEPNGVPALTLLLVGQPSILTTVERMPHWEERLGVKCLLRPFNESETAAYVEHRLRVAGSSRSIVEPDALPTLQELTNGIARRINRLCDLALLVGYAEEQPTLERQPLRVRLPRVGGGDAGVVRFTSPASPRRPRRRPRRRRRAG